MNDIIEIVTPKGFDDIPRLQLPGVAGFPGPTVFVGNVKDVCDTVEAAGQFMYYVLAMQEVKYTDEKGKSASTKFPQIFKILKSRSFRSVRPDTSNVLDLLTLETKTSWNLPKMPWSLLDTVDVFLRAVHTKHGTEGIVILTYDDAFRNAEDPTQGWGFVVPDQENTGAHCDYKPDSIAARLPNETTYTVGTIHSHPMMAAFASGTDHADQADEDGLHITFGWSKKTNMETEYHVELAAGKVNYDMEISQIAAPRPKVPVNLVDLDDLLTRVKKATGTPISEIHGGWQGGYGSGGAGAAATSHYGSNRNRKVTDAAHYPKGDSIPSLDKNLVIAVIDTEAKQMVKCPFCDVPMTFAERTAEHRCLMCKHFVGGEDEVGTMDAIEALDDRHVVKIAAMTKTRDVYVWRPSAEPDKHFEKIFSGTPASVGDVPPPPKA